jgi:acyl-CoA thioesterase YciA
MTIVEDHSDPAIRVLMMPSDTNSHGTIFGGVILSHLDMAGAIAARRYSPKKFVTVALDKVVFKEAVLVGDLLSFFGTVIHVGRTSLTVRISVFADRFTDPHTRVKVTEADAVFVAIDDDRNPIPIHEEGSTP